MSSGRASFGGIEKRLRTAHRAALESAPDLRREFRRNRKKDKARASRIARSLLMPVFWTSIFLGLVHKQSDIGWVAAIIALWATGTAFKWGNQWFQQFYASEDLVVLNLLPLDDRDIFRFQLRRYFFGAAWIGWELLLSYAVLAIHPSGQNLPILAVLLAAILQTILVLALALHAASYLHMLPLATLAAFFRVSAFVLLILGIREFEFTTSLVRTAEWFLPTGWTNYVLLQWSRDWSILALIIPIAAIVYLARFSFQRLVSFFSLEGFEIVPGPAHVQGGDEELNGNFVGHRAGPTEIEDRVRARYFLEGVNWNLGRGLEKFVARFLNPRERVITEFLVAHDPGWTRSLRWSFWIWVVACVAVLAFGRFGGMIVFFAAYVLGAASLPLFGGDWRGMRQSPAGGVYIPGYALYPIGFNEMAKIFLKVNLARISAAAPFIISFAALAAYALDRSILSGALMGVKFLGIVFFLQPFLVLFPISSTTNDTSRMLGVWILVFAPVFILMIVAGAGVFISSTVAGLVASYGLLLSLSILLFVIYRRAYRKGRFDLLSERSRNGEG